ncbi:hypothetical protein ACS0TY_007067 [Phlomoides rotata]
MPSPALTRLQPSDSCPTLTRLHLHALRSSHPALASSASALFFRVVKSSLPNKALYEKEKNGVSWPKQLNAPLEVVDPEIADIIEHEKARQWKVYALMSFLSLVLDKSTIYFNSIREIYEAWVIYNFLSLCLAWVGGLGAVVVSLS